MTNTKKNVLESESKEFAERIRINQQKLSSKLSTKFDYIVVGAGTSGSVVAGRLASDLNTRVLLLEAGESDETELISHPNRWPMTLGSELHWHFMTEPNPKLNGRSLRYSMGKVLGGGSSINVSTWSRGHQADWNFYAEEAGDPSWSYRGILDLYRRRIEAWAGMADPDYRGMHGTVHVQPAADPQPFAFALLEAAESVGIHRFPNPNGCMMEVDRGCSLVDETVRNGKRQSIFRSYVYPLMDQPNITVLTGALALRILIESRRATGIKFRYQGKTIQAEAIREVILSLGAIHTPKLLMQSGIRDEAELTRADIPVLQALPGVGRNLHDHVAFGCSWGEHRQNPSFYSEKSDCMLLENEARIGCTQLLLLLAPRTRRNPREYSPFQTPSCILVVGGRHATEKPRHDPSDGEKC